MSRKKQNERLKKTEWKQTEQQKEAKNQARDIAHN